MNKVLWFIFLGVLGLVGVTIYKELRTDPRTEREARRADSLAAILDTSRAVSGRDLVTLRTIYGDSIRAAERRTLQTPAKPDALDDSLHRVTNANAVLTARIVALQTTVTGTVLAPTMADSDSVRAEFHIRKTPYTVDADVALPRFLPELGRMTLTIRPDSARIVVRNQCGTDGVFRPATLLVVSPEWLPITIDSSRSDPAVCNAPKRKRARVSIGPSVNFDLTGRVSFGISGQLSLWSRP